jgi:adenylosuccinate synthase
MRLSSAVIDLTYGDSGKGSFVAYLCSLMENPMVVRYSGGHQAGHTVVKDDLRHVFSSFGSGTLQGVPTYWSEQCVFYPVAFMNELVELREKGITPKIFVNGKCPVTTPDDIAANKVWDKEKKHGSCGVGFGKTLEREEKYYSLLVEDLQFPSVFIQKLKQIREYYNLPAYNMTDIDMTSFMFACYEICDHITIVNSDFITKMHNVIYEGSQGLMLDKNIGYFPHVTRANVGSNALPMNPDIVYYITRAYGTRHGNGPLANEKRSHNIKVNPNETNVTNYQGEFRRAILDLDTLKYAICKDQSYAKERMLVITCLDHVENDLRFTHNGDIIYSSNEREFVTKICNILGFKEVFISKSEDFQYIEKWRI